jgi:hypothetical protein
MLFIYGANIAYWTGILAGVFFVLVFLSCYCALGTRGKAFTSFQPLRRHHRKVIWLTLISLIAHVAAVAL